MQNPARRAARMLAAFAGGAVLVAIALLAPAAPAAAENEFEVTHSASYENATVPTGAVLAIFTSVPVTTKTHYVPPEWEQELDDGLYVQASCKSDGTPIKLPILYAGASGSGTQLNVYYPNDKGDEPWGECPFIGESRFLIHPAANLDPPAKNMTRTIIVVPAHPGMYGADGGAPAGEHLDRVSEESMAHSRCRELLPADPTQCRVRTNGKPAEITLVLTGADMLACDPCGVPENFGFQLHKVVDDEIVGDPIVPDIIHVKRIGQGVEEARLRLPEDLDEGTYRIRSWTEWSGVSPQDMRVEFGRPT
ncbi:MAG TPA: hypothetical protein VFR67_26435 [Pilimelia sp.]|nr:hypothetical protein [Pilimelia sp.]